jgi:hypothetical protein
MDVPIARTFTFLNDNLESLRILMERYFKVLAKEAEETRQRKLVESQAVSGLPDDIPRCFP